MMCRLGMAWKSGIVRETAINPSDGGASEILPSRNGGSRHIAAHLTGLSCRDRLLAVFLRGWELRSPVSGSCVGCKGGFGFVRVQAQMQINHQQHRRVIAADQAVGEELAELGTTNWDSNSPASERT